MKNYLHKVLTAVFLLLIPVINFAQAPPLGTAADFVLFTSVGAMTNVGTPHLTLLTGNVGTNSGSNTNFGNVNGVMHAGDGASTQCAADLLSAYNFLADAIPDSTIVNPVLGNDSTYLPGTYQLSGASSLSQTMSLDAMGNPNAVFIFKMPAGPPNFAFSTEVNAEVKLINGAQASNVYWFVTGAVSIGTNTKMKGTIVAGGAIAMSAGNDLEGRALTINGEVSVNNGFILLSAHLPVDISAPLNTGPAAPVFVESKPYAVFSSLGPVSDDGTSHVTGSVGSNSALPTGWNPLFVSGNIDGPGPATAGAKDDLLLVYNSLNTLTADIELLYPAQFGHNLVLTPHSYLMSSAVTFTDTVILNGTGNEDAVFIIKTEGAFAAGVNSRVLLKNGTQAKNVYWMVNGAVSIGDNSVFKGTIIANNGAIDLLSGASLDGRALTTNGSISTTGMTTALPIPEFEINHENIFVCDGDSAGFVVTVIVDDGSSYTYQWRKGSVNLSNGGNISGVTNDTLVIDPVSASDTASDYNVLIFDDLQPRDTSAHAALSFHPVTTITKEPANQAVCAAGDLASFSVTASGHGLTYQWRKGTTNLANTGNISGATSDTLTINSVQVEDEALNYNVVVTDTCGQVVTSANVSLSISTDIIINTQPTDQIDICQDTPVSFSVTATGADLTYQWRKGTVNLTNTGNIAGATSATLTVYSVSAADVASDYNVIVSGTCASDVTSDNASLSIITCDDFWDGGDNTTSWTDANNWSNDSVPSPTSNLTIGADKNVEIAVATEADCNNLTIDGSLIIKSDNTGNGSLIVNGTVDGNITVQSYVTGLQWHGINAPVSGIESGDLMIGGTDVYLLKHDEPSNAYSYVTSTTQSLGTMGGFFTWIDGSANTYSFAGNLNTGTLSTDVTTGGAGYNFIGNPWSSAIDWEATTGWGGTSTVTDNVWVYTGSAFTVYNRSTQVGDGSRYIAMNQGFFVEATAAGTLTATNAVCVHNGVPFRNHERSEQQVITLELSSNDQSDKTFIVFKEGATKDYEGTFDAHKLFSFNADYPQIYSTANDFMAINSLPYDYRESIAMDVRGENGNEMTISATETADIDVIYLQDKATDIIVDLKEESYTFTYDSGITDRFTIRFGSTGINENPIAFDAKVFDSNGAIQVILSEFENVDINVFNLLGQNVASQSATGTHSRINVQQSGYYLVQLSNGTKIFTQKVFIK
ncbi:MAG: ice-binding family protein [Bacteroidales bacterium]|nr:ice-binding family protein [Bacteroidales bacterium]